MNDTPQPKRKITQISFVTSFSSGCMYSPWVVSFPNCILPFRSPSRSIRPNNSGLTPTVNENQLQELFRVGVIVAYYNAAIIARRKTPHETSITHKTTEKNYTSVRYKRTTKLLPFRAAVPFKQREILTHESVAVPHPPSWVYCFLSSHSNSIANAHTLKLPFVDRTLSSTSQSKLAWRNNRTESVATVTQSSQSPQIKVGVD